MPIFSLSLCWIEFTDANSRSPRGCYRLIPTSQILYYTMYCTPLNIRSNALTHSRSHSLICVFFGTSHHAARTVCHSGETINRTSRFTLKGTTEFGCVRASAVFHFHVRLALIAFACIWVAFAFRPLSLFPSLSLSLSLCLNQLGHYVLGKFNATNEDDILSSRWILCALNLTTFGNLFTVCAIFRDEMRRLNVCVA